MTRLTYKSVMGDYGSVIEYQSKNDEIQALRNRLGMYEDSGYEPEELLKLRNGKKNNEI